MISLHGVRSEMHVFSRYRVRCKMRVCFLGLGVECVGVFSVLCWVWNARVFSWLGAGFGMSACFLDVRLGMGCVSDVWG